VNTFVHIAEAIWGLQAALLDEVGNAEQRL